MKEPGRHQEPLEDEKAAHPVPSAWRGPLREVVEAFVEGDYALNRGVRSVAPVAPNTADQIRRYIAAHGETLSDLPEETWASSVSQWMGTHWDVLVDLWTEESGASDLVLHSRVFESEGGFRIEIDSVHVP